MQWCKLFKSVSEKHAPTKTRVKNMNIPWMTPDLQQSMRDRDFHLKQAHKTNLQQHWDQYRQLRCQINQQVKINKSNYYQHIINNNKDNPAGLWKTLIISPNLENWLSYFYIQIWRSYTLSNNYTDQLRYWQP